MFGALFSFLGGSAISPLITAALVGVSGHMGSRAIFQIEKMVESRFGPK